MFCASGVRLGVQPASKLHFTPTSDFSRIFTMIYIFIGLGLLVAFLSSSRSITWRRNSTPPTVCERI